jgi:hypothetical protein
LKNILHVGQCKQGSNSLFNVLSAQKELTAGNDIRAMVRKHTESQEYMDNWNGINISETKYLLDKSIINPDKYDYHVGNWRNYDNKMIYMVRDIYKVLKSQFLVVLAGEESYRYGIPKFGKSWDTSNFSEKDALEVMDYNKQKYTHLYNIKNLPKDVFEPSKNVLFTTFEDFITDTEGEFARVSEFLDSPISHKGYPRENTTEFEWYAGQTTTYAKNSKLFEKYKDVIFDHCVSASEWEELSGITGIDFLTKYRIK